MFLSLYYWNLLQILALGSSQFTFIAVVMGWLLQAMYSEETKGGSHLKPSLYSHLVKIIIRWNAKITAVAV